MYGSIYRNFLFPAYEALRGRHLLRYLDELELSQWLPREEVLHRQWAALTVMLRHAYEEVPFYKKAFDEAGVCPEDIRSPEDMRRIPLLEKRHLQEQQEELIARSYRNVPLILAHSGGSTGQPVAFRYHRNHYDRRCAAWARADRWGGWEMGERQVMFWLGVGSGVGERSLREVWKDRLHWKLMNWKVFTCTHITADSAREYHAALRRFRPRNMFAFGQSAYTLALLLKELGLESPAMQGIILGGEKTFGYQKKIIEEIFHTPVFERYGCQEFCNIGEECDRHDGMHINADGLYLEVVGEDGRPLRPGQVGEIIATSLDNFAMPFIRYRIGDMGVMAEGPCSCGRGLPRIKDVVGRTLDMIVTPEGVICGGIMMPHFMKEFESVREFQFVQEAVDSLILKVVPGTGFDASIKAYLVKELRRWVGPTMRITIQESSSLERAASGKYRMVVSKLRIEDITKKVAEKMK